MHLLVVGGNGFLGSAVCKAALSRGWRVSSISRSGQPYCSPKGHSPAWVNNVQWHAASALHPSTYNALLPSVTAVVHSVGTLLPSPEYKRALRTNNLSAILSHLLGSNANPLKPVAKEYEFINRDAALTVLQTFLSTKTVVTADPRTFVFVSAEDIFRPFIPKKYIETKLQAEAAIRTLCNEHSAASVKPLFIRPGLMYHAHLRPLTSPLAAFLSISAKLNAVSSILPNLLRSLAPNKGSHQQHVPPASHALAKLLETHPMHVDHVASAICQAIEQRDTRDVVGVKVMRSLVGFEDESATETVPQ